MKKIRARKYQNQQEQAVYDLYRFGTMNINFGGGLASAYRRGLHSPREAYIRGSLARAAWAAGVDHQHEASQTKCER